MNETKQTLEEWQIEQIEKGIRQADAGEFATPEEVEAVFRKFKDSADPPVSQG